MKMLNDPKFFYELHLGPFTVHLNKRNRTLCLRGRGAIDFSVRAYSPHSFANISGYIDFGFMWIGLETGLPETNFFVRGH
jgi:hypothetical protein